MAYHRNLTGTELHENKGVASAADDSVATATAGATVWKKLGADNLDPSAVLVNTVLLNAIIDDVGTAGTSYIVAPYNGTLDWVSLVLQAATATTDTIITFKNSGGVVMDTLTIPLGSIAGSVHAVAFASSNSFLADGIIIIETDGGSSSVSKAALVFSFTAVL